MNSIPFSPPSPATPCANRLPARPPVGAFVAWSAVFAGTGLAVASGHPWSHGALYLVGVALGVVLTHTGFGFASAYRRLFLNRDAGLVGAQLWLLALTLAPLAPILALGQGWGLTAEPTVAPLALSVVAGAALFGIGMQLAGGCGSGSLYALGGGGRTHGGGVGVFLRRSVRGQPASGLVGGVARRRRDRVGRTVGLELGRAAATRGAGAGLWIASALPGIWFGIRLRPLFGLTEDC